MVDEFNWRDTGTGHSSCSLLVAEMTESVLPRAVMCGLVGVVVDVGVKGRRPRMFKEIRVDASAEGCPRKGEEEEDIDRGPVEWMVDVKMGIQGKRTDGRSSHKIKGWAPGKVLERVIRHCFFPRHPCPCTPDGQFESLSFQVRYLAARYLTPDSVTAWPRGNTVS
jgi:hypothetical protein